MQEGQDALAQRFVYQANQYAATHFYQLHSRWLYKSDEQTFQDSLAKAERLSPADKLQVDYLKKTSTLNTLEFVSQANNICEASDFYFTAADKAYVAGETELAKFYLEKVLEQKAVRELSYLWASALLAKGLGSEAQVSAAGIY